MPNERTYYVICEDKCMFESMTKEQIIAAIAEATGETPTSIDDAFITKVKEQNHNASLKWWAGTQAEYNAIATPASDVLYIITDVEDNSVVKGDFAVVTGSITLTDGAGSTNINYPTGFDKDNCVVVSAGINMVSASVYDYYVGQSSVAIGVRLNSSNIRVAATNLLDVGASSTKDVKVVLMKI